MIALERAMCLLPDLDLELMDNIQRAIQDSHLYPTFLEVVKEKYGRADRRISLRNLFSFKKKVAARRQALEYARIEQELYSGNDRKKEKK
jgi:hypothetical protein